MTAAAAQPRIDAARVTRTVETVQAGTLERGWETFAHFERIAAGRRGSTGR